MSTTPDESTHGDAAPGSSPTEDSSAPEVTAVGALTEDSASYVGTESPTPAAAEEPADSSADTTEESAETPTDTGEPTETAAVPAADAPEPAESPSPVMETPAAPAHGPATPAAIRPTPGSLLGRPIPAATSFGRVDADGAVYVRLPDGNEHQVGVWATGDPKAGLEFYATKYQDLVSEIDLAAMRLAEGRATPAQAQATAERVREALSTPNFVGDMAALVARIGQLEVLVNVKKASAAEAKAAERERVGEQREALVTEAESLADSDAWRVTSERFKTLVDEWKALPRGDRTSENAQWKRLSAARATFDKRRRVHYAELEAARDSAKAAKEKLVAEAKALSDSTDWAKTTRAYRDLLDRWKQAGRAGKSDDALWEQFRAAQDAFFKARNATYSARDDAETQALAVKEDLLKQAEAILPVKDVRSAKRALHSIQDRWEKAGRVPRGDVKRLESRLKAVEDAVRATEASKVPANPELRGRALDTVTTFRDSVTKLEKKLAQAQASGNEAAIAKAEQAVESAKALLAAAERGLAKFGG